jgi:hypothetical protein
MFGSCLNSKKTPHLLRREMPGGGSKEQSLKFGSAGDGQHGNTQTRRPPCRLEKKGRLISPTAQNGRSAKRGRSQIIAKLQASRRLWRLQRSKPRHRRHAGRQHRGDGGGRERRAALVGVAELRQLGGRRFSCWRRPSREAITASISAGAGVAPCAGQSAFAGPLARVAAAIPEAVADTPESS